MYYDEQYINGILCHRNTPNGEWIPFTIKQLSEKIKNIRSTGWALRNIVEEYLREENIKLDVVEAIENFNNSLF